MPGHTTLGFDGLSVPTEPVTVLVKRRSGTLRATWAGLAHCEKIKSETRQTRRERSVHAAATTKPTTCVPCCSSRCECSSASSRRCNSRKSLPDGGEVRYARGRFLH